MNQGRRQRIPKNFEQVRVNQIRQRNGYAGQKTE